MAENDCVFLSKEQGIFEKNEMNDGRLSFGLWNNGDMATGTLDFRMKTIGEITDVFVFMHTDRSSSKKDISTVLDSFSTMN